MPAGLLGEGLRALMAPRFDVLFLRNEFQDAAAHTGTVDALVVHLDVLKPGSSPWEALRDVKVRVVLMTRRSDDMRIASWRARGGRFLVSDETRTFRELSEMILSSLPCSQLGSPSVTEIGLSPKETQVLRLMAQGRSDAEIARAIFISVNGVKKHVKGILQKMGATNRTEAAVRAVVSGTVTHEVA